MNRKLKRELKIYIILFNAITLLFFINILLIKTSALTIENDVYILSSAADLKIFADSVNSGNANLNARLKSNIDLSYLCSQQDGGWIPVGSVTLPYSGIFDGNGYCISGITIESEELYCGLFGVSDGNIKNLTVDGNICSLTGSAGGIAGLNNLGTIENCIFNGTVFGNIYSSGIAGENGIQASILNCCAKMTRNEGGQQFPIAHDDGGRFKNCFYNDELDDDGILKTTAVASDAFSSGELCWKLNDALKNTVWYQNIDCGTANAYPVPTQRSNTVYKTACCSSDESFYSNYNTVHHNFLAGSCIECGLNDVSTESAAMILNDSIDMKYFIKINNPLYYNHDLILNYSFNNDSTDMSTICIKETDDLYYAVIPCRTDKMNSKIYTKVSVTENSLVVYTDPQVTEYSIIQYADKILSGNETTYNDTCKKLILNILKYGSEAQKYFSDDNSMEFVLNENFLEYFNEYNIELPSAENINLFEHYLSIDDPNSEIYSVYLTLNSKICININIRSQSEGNFLKFRDMSTGETRTVPLSASNETNKYKAVIEDISAENLLNNFCLTVVDKDENAISNTICYNIENYIDSIENSLNSEIRKAESISRALLGYAKAVKDYCINLN